MFADRVFETTTSTGTGAITLAGAQSGYRGYVDAGFTNGEVVTYHERNADGSIWESGYGALDTSAGTIQRNLLESSTGSLINWGSGTKFVYIAPLSAILKSLVKGNLAAARPGWLPAGGRWADSVNGLLKYYTGSADVALLPLTAATQGDILYYGAAGVPARLAAGTAGQALITGGAGQNPSWATVVSALPRGFISGLVPAKSAAQSIQLSAGACRDGGNAANIELAAALAKDISSTWAVGDGNGGLDTGALANNTDYFVWAIKRSDTGVSDALVSLSATAPTMPTNYDLKRLAGWFSTDGSGNIVDFNAYELSGGGLDYSWDDPPLDVDLANTLTTSRRLDALSVPVGFSVIAQINVYQRDASSTAFTYICNPDKDDETPTSSGGPLMSIISTTAKDAGAELRVRTNASGQIASRSGVATVDTYRISTLGFEWSRR
ncbi:MAG: hypothetical protein Kow00114_36080 [Kiloniellaceae bacterium]